MRSRTWENRTEEMRAARRPHTEETRADRRPHALLCVSCDLSPVCFIWGSEMGSTNSLVCSGCCEAPSTRGYWEEETVITSM